MLPTWYLWRNVAGHAVIVASFCGSCITPPPNLSSASHVLSKLKGNDFIVIVPQTIQLGVILNVQVTLNKGIYEFMKKIQFLK